MENTLEFSRDVASIEKSKLLHDNWYLQTYPDVAETGMTPAEHYLRIGAILGRNPGKGFDTKYYLETHPDARESGLNPLLHYLRIGRERKYAPKPPVADWPTQVKYARLKLLSLGFTEEPLAELQRIVSQGEGLGRMQAARELVTWYMREKSEEGYRRALRYIAEIRKDPVDLENRARFATAELICHYFLGEAEAAKQAYEEAALRGEMSSDLRLARVNLCATPEQKLVYVNHVLDAWGMSRLGLLPDTGGPLYDRLTAAAPVAKILDGPKVTVLIAAYEAEAMLPTALRSLQEQSWANLEILLLDDCSPGPGTVDVATRLAKDDPRIRVVRMETNGGAYAARNHGLSLATGEFVTLHDADDWSHPQKIEQQVRYLQANPEAIGCTSQQARATNELCFSRANAGLNLLNLNTSSFMFRRAEVVGSCGGWDDTRFGADTELIRRLSSVYGKDCIRNLVTGPCSFQRISESSIVADPHFGIQGLAYGVRFIYHEAYRVYHAQDRHPMLDADRRTTFATPNVMRRDRRAVGTVTHFDVVTGADFRMPTASTRASIEEMLAQQKHGVSQAHFHMFRYDLNTERSCYSVLAGAMETGGLEVLGYGEKASCDLLILRNPPILQHRQRYLPQIEAANIRVIIDEPPMSDYSDGGVRRYDLASCARNLREQFGKDAVWHPSGPWVRELLSEHHWSELHHIDLSPHDWHDVLDLAAWADPGRKPGPAGKLRIGRQCFGHPQDWPAEKEEILAAYPECGDVEVHVLGGVETASRLLGHRPKTWRLHGGDGSQTRNFLKDIDVYVHFAASPVTQGAGRGILEAMAAGVPVILPEACRSQFKEAAIYAGPQDCIATAKALLADQSACAAQIERARAFLRKSFSQERHIQRIGGYIAKPRLAV